MASNMSVPLSSGQSVPAMGYGTWQAKDEELEDAMNKALSVGYRHIDTAYVYENEHVIGKVLKEWIDTGKVKREELFITTKLPLYGNRPEDVEKYLSESLKRLQLSYVDLYLIHAPIGYIKESENISDWKLDPKTDLAAIWKEMENQVDNGKTKAIGVSNFNKKQIENLLKTARISPVTNQIEFHVYLQQPELLEFLKKHNIIVTAYSPLGKGALGFAEMRGITVDTPSPLQDPLVINLSKKYNKTAAQILLRHIIQRGLIAIPKSTNLERMKQNIEIFDFDITDADMESLNSLDRNGRMLHFHKFFKGCEKHPEYPF